MKKLNALDNMFLLMDRPDQKMHIVAYAVFEKPADAPDNYVQNLVEDMRRNPWPLPHYDEKLHRSIGTLGRYCWVEAKDMDMNHHVRLVTLQGSDAEQALRDYTTDLYATALDYDRPMWEMHVIDGLERRNEFAMAFKVHHCSIDGISAKNVIEEVLRPDPTDLSNPDMHRKKNHQKTRFNTSLPKMSRLERLNTYWKGLGTIRGQIKSGETMLIPPPDAVPVTRFNTLVEPTRSFATISLALTLVAEIARATHSTINDVISAIVGTAMRRYLDGKGESPAKSLYATMPISIHIDRLLFGLASDKTKAPDIEKIGQHMQDALEEMQMTILGTPVPQEA